MRTSSLRSSLSLALRVQLWTMIMATTAGGFVQPWLLVGPPAPKRAEATDHQEHQPSAWSDLGNVAATAASGAVSDPSV